MNLKKSSYKNWNVIAIEGDFAVTTLVKIREEFEKLERQGEPRVALDLSAVEYVDSSAIGIMVNFYKRMTEKNGDFVVFNPSAEVNEIFEMVSFGHTVPVYQTQKDFEQAAEGNTP